MNTNDKKSNGLEIMSRINEFTKDADWSVEELREELINEKINPDELIENVMRTILPFLPTIKEKSENIKDLTRIRKFGLISNQSENLVQIEQVESLDDAPTLLSLLRKFTSDMPSSIAQKLGVNVSFLRGCNDSSNNVPTQCKNELIRRVGNVYPFIDRNKVEKVVEKPTFLKKAALRDKEYSGSQMSFEEIVKKSNMDSEVQKFWLELAQENADETSK
jgi:hypothetical protein